VLVFLFGETQQDVTPCRVVLTSGKQLVGMRGFDFAAPHFFDGRQIDLIYSHEIIRRISRTA
jgi:hypothetical protein